MAKFSMKDHLNVQSKNDVVDVPKETTWEIVEISLDKIKPSKENFYGIRDIEELAASIEELGLLHNIAVQETGNGDYIILSGERRYHALRLLEWKSAPCRVFDKDCKTAFLQLLLANATARELTDYEKMMQSVKIREELQRMKACGYPFSGRMRENTAQWMGVSSAQVGIYESIYKNLTSEQMQGFKSGCIGISEACTLSRKKKKAPTPTLSTHKETIETNPKPTPPKSPQDVPKVVSTPIPHVAAMQQDTPLTEHEPPIAAPETPTTKTNPDSGNDVPFCRHTEYDEHGNAEIIGIDSEALFYGLELYEADLLMSALNDLAFYEDMKSTLVPAECHITESPKEEKS